jgi:TrmH family RNA methyltransferase
MSRPIVPQCYPSGVTITSRQNPLVARFRDAARGGRDGVMLLDGAHLIGDAVAAGVSVQLAAVASGAEEKRDDLRELLAALARAGVELVDVSSPVMDAISPVRSSSAVVALAARPVVEREQLYTGAAPMMLVAADVQDPGNVGAIVRVAEAAGASGVVAAGTSASPFGWKALRGSMGSALRLPIVSGTSVDEAVDEARRHGCRIVATVPRDGVSIFDADLGGPIAVLIGGEGHGLPQAIVEGADERVTIPMQAPVESLNAAVTAALILYEARRQRATTKDTKHTTTRRATL